MIRYAPVFCPVLGAAVLAALSACAEGEPPQDPALVEAGRQVFGACAACHSTQMGGGHKAGPNLYGVAGTPAAQAAGYDYSVALASSGLVWDDATLHAYLADPTGTVEGGKMIYAGLEDEADRDAVIAYLKSKR